MNKILKEILAEIHGRKSLGTEIERLACGDADDKAIYEDFINCCTTRIEVVLREERSGVITRCESEKGEMKTLLKCLALTKDGEDHVVDWNTFSIMVHALLGSKSLLDVGYKSIYGIPRGGVPLACYLSHGLNLMLVSRNHVGPWTLVVDDVADSGSALNKMFKELDFEPDTAVLIKKTCSLVEPTYYAVESDRRWIHFPWEAEDSKKS